MTYSISPRTNEKDADTGTLDSPFGHEVSAVAERGQVVIRCSCGQEFAKGRQIPTGSLFGWTHLTRMSEQAWRLEHPNWPHCHNH
jgi:hypothetical protein